MKVLLINTPWEVEGHYGVRAGSRWPHFEKTSDDPNNSRPYMPFPFYMGYAAAMLLEKNHEVCAIDAIADALNEEDTLQKVKEFSPDIIVQEVSTPTIKTDIYFSNIFHYSVPEAKIVFVGPNALMFNEDFLKNELSVDFVIDGEYEHVLCKLADALGNSKPLNEIGSLMFREDENTIIKTEQAELIKDIDEIPWPARDLFSMKRYQDEVGGLPLPSLQVWASRGCPFNCSFCLWPQLMYRGRNYRVRNPEDVADEIKSCVDKWGFKSFYFDDDTFNIGKDRILALVKALKDRGINMPFAAMARADTMDEEQLLALKSAGLYSIKYGVESASQDIVTNCGKGLDLEKVKQAVHFTKKHNIKLHLTFTFGLPGETKETIEQTINFAKELDPDTVQFSIATPFPGSRYYNELDEKGYVLSKDWNDYTGYTRAVIRTDELEHHDLEQALRKANRSWRIHLFLKNKEFSAAKLKDYIQSLNITDYDNVYMLCSSFKEHINLIYQEFSAAKKDTSVSMVTTENNFSDFAGYNDNVVGLKTHRFTVRALKKDLNIGKKDLIVLPMNNTLCLGYEDFINDLKEETQCLAIDTDGNIH